MVKREINGVLKELESVNFVWFRGVFGKMSRINKSKTLGFKDFVNHVFYLNRKKKTKKTF